MQDAHRCCAVVVVTQLTFGPKQKYATDGAAAPNSGDASTKTPEACATLKSRLKTYQRCTLKVAAAKVGALVSADVSYDDDVERCRLRAR